MSGENERLRELARLNAADWDLCVRRAGELMADGRFGCSEAVVMAFQGILGETLPASAVALAGSFRGGVSSGCLCGALAAGEMVLGAFFGYYGGPGGRPDPEETKRAKALYQELHDRFKEAAGAVCCRLLTEAWPQGSPERRARCARLVEISAALTGGLLARESAEMGGSAH